METRPAAARELARIEPDKWLILNPRVHRRERLSDSDHSRAWRVPHSAFLDRTARATKPRHSIEFRTIAYFE
jgi:hypothetical protein